MRLPAFAHLALGSPGVLVGLAVGLTVGSVVGLAVSVGVVGVAVGVIAEAVGMGLAADGTGEDVAAVGLVTVLGLGEKPPIWVGVAVGPELPRNDAATTAMMRRAMTMPAPMPMTL